jgi:hypothetical protein
MRVPAQRGRTEFIPLGFGKRNEFRSTWSAFTGRRPGFAASHHVRLFARGLRFTRGEVQFAYSSGKTMVPTEHKKHYRTLPRALKYGVYRRLQAA